LGKFLVVEISGIASSIDSAIQEYFRLFQALPAAARDIWQRCDRRSMNVGFQSTEPPKFSEFVVSERSVELICLMRADIRITVYGVPYGLPPRRL